MRLYDVSYGGGSLERVTAVDIADARAKAEELSHEGILKIVFVAEVSNEDDDEEPEATETESAEENSADDQSNAEEDDDEEDDEEEDGEE